jgi:acyl-CoA synthetase (AMP-forming)/AMP-acid ligase II
MMHEITMPNIFKAVDTYKPFLAFGFPTYLMALATSPDAEKIDRSSLEIMCTGGLVISAKIYETLLTIPNVKAVMNGFGMTECGAVSTTVDLNWPHGIRAIPNLPPLTVGRLYPNTSLKVLDLSTGKTLGPNEKGELAIKSPVMCTGYLNRPEESAKTFQDEWLRTGDLGYYDTEGFIFIVDRIKETFKYFNNHISPSDLEEILVQHPAIAEASVFGIVDPEGGDHIPRAVVTLKPGASAQPEEIRTFVDEKVASYKRLRGGVFIVPSLPRGKTGKVVRSMVASLQLE